MPIQVIPAPRASKRETVTTSFPSRRRAVILPAAGRPPALGLPKMPDSPPLFVRLHRETRGPFTLDQLRELAEAGVITPETAASAQAAGPWSPLRDLPDGGGLFRARPQFQFKARDFEAVNRPEAAPVDHRALIAAANQGRAPPPGGRPAASSNEVVEILQENTRLQLQHERPVDLTPRPNRRRRDYLIAMTVVNGFFVASLLYGGGGIFALSGIVICSAGITWIMFGVMDRY